MSANQPQQPVEKIVHQGLRLDHDEDRGRFSLWHGSTYIGFIGYHREDDVVTIQHTIVNEEFGRIVPECSYVQDYLRRYPEYQDMVVKG